MIRYRSILISVATMFSLAWLGDIPAVERMLQVPSGVLAAGFLGAPFRIDADGVAILLQPLLMVTGSCSGTTLFAFLAGLGAGYWCGNRLRRWLLLFPLAYGMALLGNAARISMAWQFRRLTNGQIPEWLQEYAHMGIGMVCSLTLAAALLYWINLTAKNDSEIREETVS